MTGNFVENRINVCMMQNIQGKLNKFFPKIGYIHYSKQSKNYQDLAQHSNEDV